MVTGRCFLLKKREESTDPFPLFANSPCSDNRPRFVYHPALSGSIESLARDRSDSDITLVPKLVPSSQSALVLLH